MREIKFRAWMINEIKSYMVYSDGLGSFFDHEIYGRNYMLMEFIGYCDNYNKEIYEGDVVDCIRDNVIYRAVVKDIRHIPEEVLSWRFDKRVIGNIYENPNLIK